MHNPLDKLKIFTFRCYLKIQISLKEDKNKSKGTQLKKSVDHIQQILTEGGHEDWLQRAQSAYMCVCACAHVWKQQVGELKPFARPILGVECSASTLLGTSNHLTKKTYLDCKISGGAPPMYISVKGIFIFSLSMLLTCRLSTTRIIFLSLW